MKKHHLIIFTAILITLISTVPACLWINSKTDAIRRHHPTAEDARIRKDIWHDVQAGLADRPDILNNDHVAIYADAARRWAIKVTVYGVKDGGDQDLIVRLMRKSLEKYPEHQAWIEFYEEQTETRSNSGTIHHHSKNLLRKEEFAAIAPNLRSATQH